MTKADPSGWDPLAEVLHEVLETELPGHDPHYEDPASEKKVGREEVSPEVREIGELPDRTAHAYVAADGGGIEVLGRRGNMFFIRYQGACASCPSSISGTPVSIPSVFP